MEVIVLDDKLFNQNKLQKDQITHNKNGSRPYYYSFKRNNNNICVPFRTNTRRVPNKYKEKLGNLQPYKPDSAVDLTKSIVLSNEEYLKHKSRANIPPKVNKFLKEPAQRESIERKFDTMLNDYIKAKSKNSNIPLTKISTLQYFHNELNIQDTIDNKLTKNAITELISNGKSNKYNKLQTNLPSEKLELLDDYETLYEFKNLTDYPAKINSIDINNPYLEIEKDNKHFNLSAVTIKNEPEKHVKDFLNYDIDNKKNKDIDLDL
ncbi:hypothetical protein QI229_13315 [Staphylococcus saprophyticus]|nr:hypothetical protein [Staphylococcus saprophyticus]